MTTLEKFIIIALELTYQGGNNGTQFADFLEDNDLLSPELSCDDYFKIANAMYSTQPNFKHWINNDDFWADFAYTVVEEKKINLVV